MPKTHVGIRICPVRHLIGRRCKYNRKTVLAKGAQQVLYGGNNLLVDVVARERIAWPRPCIWYLAGFLRAANVDTILVTGVTACACVRQTICDGLAEGFRPIAVKEAIGDRIPGAVLWNLFDIDAIFGDVETVERCLQYLDAVGKASLDQVAGRASAA